MDYPVLEDAVEELLKGIKIRLTEINPEILIEFRQNYVGPIARQYGNIFRVADCPNDAIRNRIGVVDLRLTSDKTAIHSDMLMWNYDEDVTLAAKQIINILFSVPQISVRIEKLNDEHYKMLEYYLSFWRKYKDLLINTKIIPQNQDSNFARVISKNNNQELSVCYSENNLTIENIDEYIAVNGTSKTEFFVNSKISGSYTVYNCMGEIIENKKLKEGLMLIKVPVSGTVVFNKEA
jgi:alpha-galactosidase